MIEAYYFEFLAFLVALIRYQKLKNSYMVWFIPFLLLTAVCEFGSDIIYYQYNLPTDWIYNILIPFTIYFYGFIFYRLLRSSNLKSVFLSVAFVYLACNVYFLLTSTSFSIILLLIGAVIQIILACYYFYKCLLDDVNLNAYYIKSGLWIASGIVIFYSGISIVFSLVNYIRAHHLMINGVHLYNVVPRYLSIILYTCLSIAFLQWKKPQKN